MGNKPAYSLWPHSVSPRARLAGGSAPSDPVFFRPAAGAASGGVLHLPNPVAGAAAERCPVLADDPADMILDGPASRESGPGSPKARGAVRRRDLWPTWMAAVPRNRRTALTAIPGVLGGFGGIQGRRIPCNARTRPPEG